MIQGVLIVFVFNKVLRKKRKFKILPQNMKVHAGHQKARYGAMKKISLNTILIAIALFIFLTGLFFYFKMNIYFTDRYLWYTGMAAKYNDIGEYSRALRYAEKAILLDSERVEMRKETAKLYINFGDSEKAKQELYFLNGSAYYYWGMGYISLQEDDAAEAIKYFRAGVERHPSEGTNYLGAGLAYLKLNETEQAFAYLNSSIAMIEENSDSIKGKGLLGMAHAGLGIIYKREGSVQQSAWQFKTADSTYPRSVQRVSTLID